VLYELLSGQRAQTLPNRSVTAMLDVICAQHPPPPSAAAAGQSDTSAHSRMLRGDLDTIVACAMRKEPERRYGSAAALADDLQRPWDDKSGYLRRAGFELKNWPDLRAAIRRLADAIDAVEDGSSEYGTFYRVEGMLDGPNGTLPVVCIWMKRAIDGKFRFVTLKPSKRRSGNVSSTV
jgi:hypothetical protein